MPTAAVDLPFRISPDGTAASTRDIDRQIRQRLIGIIATNPGERIMMPKFGVGVARFVFEPDVSNVLAELTQKVKAQAASYEPVAIIARITPHPNATKGEAAMDVEYTRTDTPQSGVAGSRFVHRAIVGPGGLIAESRRG